MVDCFALRILFFASPLEWGRKEERLSDFFLFAGINNISMVLVFLLARLDGFGWEVLCILQCLYPSVTG